MSRQCQDTCILGISVEFKKGATLMSVSLYKRKIDALQRTRLAFVRFDAHACEESLERCGIQAYLMGSVRTH